MKRYYTTDNKVREFILSCSKLFNSKEELKKSVLASMSEHKRFSLEYRFFERVLFDISGGLK